MLHFKFKVADSKTVNAYDAANGPKTMAETNGARSTGTNTKQNGGKKRKPDKVTGRTSLICGMGSFSCLRMCANNRNGFVELITRKF